MKKRLKGMCDLRDTQEQCRRGEKWLGEDGKEEFLLLVSREFLFF